MSLSEPCDILWKRQRVLAELAQSCGRYSDKIHLHVIQGNEHGLDDCSTGEKILKIVPREPETRVHVIVSRPQRYDLTPLLVTTLVFQLLVQVSLTAQTSSRTTQSHTVGRLKGRQFVPFEHLRATSRNALPPRLQNLHFFSKRRRWCICRMERGKPLVALVASEQHHAGKNSMHCLYGPQRTLS